MSSEHGPNEQEPSHRCEEDNNKKHTHTPRHTQTQKLPNNTRPTLFKPKITHLKTNLKITTPLTHPHTSPNPTMESHTIHHHNKEKRHR
jgi:hypothetical protein